LIDAWSLAPQRLPEAADRAGEEGQGRGGTARDGARAWRRGRRRCRPCAWSATAARWRCCLTGSQQGRTEAVADNVAGYPDNLSRFRDGRAWVPLTNPYNRTLDKLGTTPPLLRKLA
jgi:hypothetical protein